MRKMDGRDSAECQNWEKKDIKVIMEIDLNEENDKIMNSCPLPLSKGKRKCGGEGRRGEMLEVLDLFFRVSVFLLSKFLRDPTVGSLRGKKESCSTRRGLRVGTRFREFPQTPRGRGFSLLGFYTLFKCFSMFRLA